MTQMCPGCSFDNSDEAQVCINCDSTLRGLLGKGSVLSQRYTAVGVLGYGAMGAVYLAEDNRLAGRRCAIKENRPDESLPDKLRGQAREQFLAEASVLARLDHSRLPKVSDYFVENNREYLVMDYVEGDDLVSVLTKSKQPLDEQTVLEWADQVLDALDYLHNHEPQPIIHRDIKPANLRVNSRGRVKLVDFGLVKLLDPSNPATKVELRGLGTPAYAPLEQFAGSQEHTDARSDIYALGATLYHLVTHIPPSEVHQRLFDPEALVKPRQLNPGLSEATEQAILKAMAVYPNERFQSAAEMRAALTEIAKGSQQPQPVAAPAQPRAAAAPPRRAMPLWLVSLLGVLLVGLVGSALYMFVFAGGNGGQALPRPIALAGSDPTATPASLSVQPLSDAPANEPTSAGPVVEPTATPPPTDTPTLAPPTATPTASPTTAPAAGSGGTAISPASLVGTIAYPVFNGTDFDLYFGRADGSGTMLFRKHASQPAFSADGTRIAFHSWLEPWGLVTMQLPDSEPLLIADFVEDQLPTWTSDGGEIIYLSRREGDRKSRLIKVGSTQLNSNGMVLGEGEYPTVASTGDLIFRGWGNSGTGLRLGSINFDNLQPVTQRDEDTAPSLSPNGRKVAFMSRREGNWDIFVANIDGSNPIRITSNPGDDGLPAWSPDGNVIAFVSQRDGKWGIWVTLPTGEGQRLLFELEGSPDGYVGANRNASRGWTEERISWTP
ncbi:MAG: Serine/threonine-protein kinase PknD [Anaerolineae bacterium]|nr:Serine/threonine-protein kinase PknD [Anaerolineae bacterium]